MDHFIWLLAASTTIDALVVVAALAYGVCRMTRAGRSPTVTLGVAAWALVATVAVFAIKVVALRQVGLQFFGLIHLLYLDGVVVAPLVGAALIVTSRVRRSDGCRLRLHPAVRVAAIVSLLAVPVGAYATFVEPYDLVLEKTTISLDDFESSGGPLRVAVLSDMQFRYVTAHEHRAVSMALAEHPDVIVLPGDVFQGDEQAFRQELPAIRELLGRLEAPGGVYVVQGDCESPNRLRRAIEGTNVVFLHDDLVHVNVRGVRLAVGGTRREYWSAQARETVRRLSAGAGDADVTLLVSHRPGIVLTLPQGHKIDLVIAGHTHGGQVCLPIIGPLVTKTRIPRAAAGGGLSRVNHTSLYVSRGVGCERNQAPPIRFLCPPEVSLLELTGKGRTPERSAR